MDRKRIFVDMFGNVVPEEEATDSRGILKDGFGLTTRMSMMDSGQSLSDAAATFADSAQGKSAIAYEGYVAYLNGREPKTAGEIYRDHQTAYAETAKQIADNAIAIPIARAAADAARAKMISDLNGGR